MTREQAVETVRAYLWTQIGNMDTSEMIAQKIDKLYESLGYVPRAENQDIDIPDAVFFSEEAKRCGFTKRSFREAGWVKVEKEE